MPGAPRSEEKRQERGPRGVFRWFGVRKGVPKGVKKSWKTSKKGNRKPKFSRNRFRRCFYRLLGSLTEVKSPKICPKWGPKTKTAIFRKSCSRVHGSTIFEVRRPRKSSRNLRKTVTERRRKPKRVSGVHFHDFGSVLGLKKHPKIHKKRSENDTEKQTRKNTPNGGGRWSDDGARKPNNQPTNQQDLVLI